MQGKKSSGILKHFSVKPHCVNDVKIQPLEHIRKPPHLASTKKYRKNERTLLDIPVENIGTNGFKHYGEHP